MLAPKLVHPLFIVALGTVTLVLVAPLYRVFVAVPSAVVQLLALNVTVISLLQLKYLVAVVDDEATPLIVILEPIAVPLLVELELALAPSNVQLVFSVALGTVTLPLVAPLYNAILDVGDVVVQPFALNVTVTALLQL